MAKIRGVKPEFWTDEDIVELSIPARLLFIGLWNLACDNGHVPDKPKQIKMRLLPADDVDVDALLDELAGNGRIERTDKTVTIRSFARHQKPHRRWWTTCDLPWCNVPDDAPTQGFNRGKAPSGATSQPETNGGATVGNGGATADVDCEVDCDGDGDSPSPPATVARASRKRPAKALPDDWQPTDAHRERCAEERIDIDRAVAKFRAHAEANDRRQANWNAAFTQWLLNEKPGSAPAQADNRVVNAPVEVPPDGLTDAEIADWWNLHYGPRRA